MADVSEGVLIKDAATAISQGKRHLLVRDYNLAVVVLAQACELLAQEHGETSDEMGELYLLYGRALLGLAREEAGVLGGGVPGSEEAGQDEETQEEEDDDEEDDDDDTEDDATVTAVGSSTSNGKDCNKQEQPDRKESEKNGNATEKNGKIEDLNKVDNNKIEKTYKKQKEEIPGCSRNSDPDVGESSSSTKKTEDDTENADKENEDDVNNLQIAWEVLELAKLVLLKRGSSGWKYLAEAYRLLGEVAMEGGNHETALTDLKGCLDLLQKITPRDHRAIAEIHYQLGLAYAMANDFDASIEQFKQASALLEARIVHLQNDPSSESYLDPFYTIEGEIKELKDLLPEIQEKIADIKDLKKDAGVIKEIKEDALNDAAEPDDASGNDASKPASDISHLVRKKRKMEDEADAIVCKKPTTQQKEA